MRKIDFFSSQISMRLALTGKTPAEKKMRLTDLYERGIISPSLLQWAISVNGLRGE